ncbi:MAG: hypothetical protein ACLVBP_16695 [Ruminococcus sp.]
MEKPDPGQCVRELVSTGGFDKEAVGRRQLWPNHWSKERAGRIRGEMTGNGFPVSIIRKLQYDILAAELRKHLDMKKIYEILEEGV